MRKTKKEHSKEVTAVSTFKKVIRKHEFIKEKSVTLCAEEPTVRYLKLYPFYRESKSRFLVKPQRKIVPELRLCGKWLEKAGFLPENFVSVTVMGGLLVIRSTAAVGMD